MIKILIFFNFPVIYREINNFKQEKTNIHKKSPIFFDFFDSFIYNFDILIYFKNKKMATKLETMNNDYKNIVTQLDGLKASVEAKWWKAGTTEKTAADTYKSTAEAQRKAIDTEIDNIKKDASKSATEKQEAEDIEKTLKWTEESIEALHDVILKPIEAKSGLKFFTWDVDTPNPENLIDNKPAAAKVEYTDANIKDKFKTVDSSNPKIKVEIKVTVDNNGNTVELRKWEVEVELQEAPATTPKTSLSKFTAGTAPDAKELITEDLSSTWCTIDYKDNTEKEKFNNSYKGDVILVLKDKDNRVLREVTVNNVEVEGTAKIEAETGKTFPEGTPPDAQELVKWETADDKVEYADTSAAESVFKTEWTNKDVKVKVTDKAGKSQEITVTVNVIKQNFFERIWNWISKKWIEFWTWVWWQWNYVIDGKEWHNEPLKNIWRAAWFAATGIWILALWYEWIKKLFWLWKKDSSKWSWSDSDSDSDDTLLWSAADRLLKEISKKDKK